jgi:hypothetical protein
MARPGLLVAAAALGGTLLAPVAPAGALGWGGIEPGVTTVEQVRARYGVPAREARSKVEGYDTLQWTYEGRSAPRGLYRMVVEFGLLTPAGYRPALVRVLRLDPRPAIFGLGTVIEGWGLPDKTGTQDERPVFLYNSGLVVIFDKEGANATNLYFAIPQPTEAAGEAPAGGTGPGGGAPSAPRP